MAAPYRRIMLTLDGSEFAAQAAPHAVRLARDFHAELILFQALDDLAGREAAMMAAELPAQDDGLARQQAALHQFAGLLEDESVVAKPVVVAGYAPEAILDYAHAHEVDLIVMSTHGRTGLSRWVYGSVAEKVLRRSRCPVLLVRVASHRQAA